MSFEIFKIQLGTITISVSSNLRRLADPLISASHEQLMQYNHKNQKAKPCVVPMHLARHIFAVLASDSALGMCRYSFGMSSRTQFRKVAQYHLLLKGREPPTSAGDASVPLDAFECFHAAYARSPASGDVVDVDR